MTGQKNAIFGKNGIVPPFNLEAIESEEGGTWFFSPKLAFFVPVITFSHFLLCK